MSPRNPYRRAPVTASAAPSSTPAPGGADARRAVRWMRGRGLAVMLDDTEYALRSATRALPSLAAIFLLVMIWELPLLGFTWWSGAVGAAVVLAAWAFRAATRGAAIARQRAGWLESTLFVVVPPLFGLVAPMRGTDHMESAGIPSGHVREWLVAGLAVQQVVLLALILIVVRFDVFALTRWLVHELTESVSSAGTVLSRVVPLLMVALLVSYYTTELWQSGGRMGTLPFVATIVLFALLGGAFLARKEDFDPDALSQLDDREALKEALADTPRPDAADEVAVPVRCPLTPRQERHLLIVASSSRLVLATLIGLCALGFFMVLGWLTVDAATVKTWTGAPAQSFLSWDGVGGHRYVLSWEHLRVAGFLAAFSGFYYAVASATDGTMRQGLRDTATDSIRSACALRLTMIEPREQLEADADADERDGAPDDGEGAAPEPL